MIASIIALAVFTAGITSAITTHQLQGLVRNVDDLRALRVGAVSTAVAFQASVAEQKQASDVGS